MEPRRRRGQEMREEPGNRGLDTRGNKAERLQEALDTEKARRGDEAGAEGRYGLNNHSHEPQSGYQDPQGGHQGYQDPQSGYQEPQGGYQPYERRALDQEPPELTPNPPPAELRPGPAPGPASSLAPPPHWPPNWPPNYNYSAPNYNTPPPPNYNTPPPPPNYNIPPPNYNAPPPNYNSSLNYNTPPPTNYNTPPPNYNAPPPNYSTPNYNTPPPNYTAPPTNYSTPNYNTPPPNYSTPPTNYPTPNYAPPPNYTTPPPPNYSTPPPPNYNTPPPNYNAPPTNYNTPPTNYNAPPTNYNAPPPNCPAPPPPSRKRPLEERGRGCNEHRPEKRARSPEPPAEEDEDDFDDSLVAVDTYNCDLHFKVSRDRYSGYPLTIEGFAYLWSGARATYGVRQGRVCFEMKVVEEIPVQHLPPSEPDPHVVRVGWSLDSCSTQLGEEPFSFGYGGTGRKSTDGKFQIYGETFGESDVIACLADFEAGEDVELSFLKNGQWQGVAFRVAKAALAGRALFPHVLVKNCAVEFNFGQRPQPLRPLPPDFTLIQHLPLGHRDRGTLGPRSKADCEMLMMVGLPAAGKTTWAVKHAAENPDKKYNILGTNAIMDKMRVMGLRRQRNYAGRWDVLIHQATQCLNRLIQIAARKRRNYILDQTNVYGSAQRRKMRPFAGFQRRAIVVCPTDRELRLRTEKRTDEEGKDVPDHAVLEMKANFTLPEAGDFLDSVHFVELQRDEAAELVRQYNHEGRAAGAALTTPRVTTPRVTTPRVTTPRVTTPRVTTGPDTRPDARPDTTGRCPSQSGQSSGTFHGRRRGQRGGYNGIGYSRGGFPSPPPRWAAPPPPGADPAPATPSYGHGAQFQWQQQQFHPPGPPWTNFGSSQ